MFPFATRGSDVYGTKRDWRRSKQSDGDNYFNYYYYYYKIQIIIINNKNKIKTMWCEQYWNIWEWVIKLSGETPEEVWGVESISLCWLSVTRPALCQLRLSCSSDLRIRYLNARFSECYQGDWSPTVFLGLF